MKKTTLVATAMGLALIFGTTMRSEAFCLLGCDDSTNVDQKAAGRDVRENSDDVKGNSAKGIGNTAMGDLKESVANSNLSQSNMGTRTDIKGDVSGQVNANSINMVGGVDKSHDNVTNSNTNFGKQGGIKNQ
ncbi:MAG TPA: hypothetical protein VFA47_06190 [Candidatus Manganitrophaceae bacterium]|nr:hypothetical protein [Candidatus Manganitrophaceae bacterium]